MEMDVLQEMQGHLVPDQFKPGYIILSYFVSLLGSYTTLEIINRRTAIRGVYNWLHLLAASISMGGVAIWAMHFVGNLAIVLGDGQSQIQIAYSPGFTALSFFLPIGVLSIAFWVVGSNDNVDITRIILGSFLAGFGVCGMHYLGQAGISNYDCIYGVGYVVGAAAIAIVASGVALSIFFLFKSSFTTSWWKRILSANLLAVAVSGMHWLAAVGTQYRLKVVVEPSMSPFSVRSTSLVAIVLSIVACLTLLTFTFLAQRRISRSAKRAQQVVLAAAFFNQDGKLLVTPEGRLPSHKITNSWLERSMDDVFTTSHPVFLWMFRTSRNWTSIANLLGGMRIHVHRAGFRARLGSKADSNLLNDEGIPIEDYSLVFRELFCVAAGDLAANLNIPIQKLGVLYDEIFPTGNSIKDSKSSSQKSKFSQVTTSSSIQDVERDGLSLGQGQLMFLVSWVGRKEAANMAAAGFRWAVPTSVIPIIAKSLQVGPHALTRRLDVMRDYAYKPHILDPGVHLACFAIRASLGAGRSGFEVLARKDAKNLLPTMQVSVDSLETWQCEYLEKMDSMSVSATLKLLFKDSKPKNPSTEERHFAQHLLTSLEALKAEIEDPFFNDASLIANPVAAPCRGPNEDSPPGMATLITFRIVVPIGSRAPGKKLRFVPLAFFKAQQHVYHKSISHEIFARRTYREFAPLLDLSRDASVSQASIRRSRNEVLMGETIDMYGTRVDQSVPPDRASSRIRFWDKTGLLQPRRRGNNSSEINLVEVQTPELPPLGGILISQDVDVNVGSAESQGSSRSRRSKSHKEDNQIELAVVSKKAGFVSKVSKEEEEPATFVDTLFTTTITKRHHL